MDTDELNAFKCDGKLPSERVRDAAHDLLEALEDMLNQGCGEYQKKSCGHNFYCVCPGDKARLAIAKARGQ